MKTRIQAKETVIEITSVGSTGFSSAYIGNLFVVDSFDSEGEPLTFVDWLQSPVRSLSGLGYDTENENNEPLKLNGKPALKIVSVGSTIFPSFYENKIFVINSYDSGKNPLTFIDWLKQTIFDTHIKSLNGFAYKVVARDVWSITRKTERFTTTLAEYVREKLISRFLIVKGELSHYPGEEDDMMEIGAESYLQKRKFEMDFMVRNIILGTQGVAGLASFESLVDKEMRYTAKFIVNLIDGSKLTWQTDI